MPSVDEGQHLNLRKLLPLAMVAGVMLVLLPRILGERVLPQSELDFSFHWSTATQYKEAITDGTWVPRWAPRTFGGLGSAVFVYYPPAYHALTALIAQITRSSVWTSMRVVELMALLGLGSTWMWAARQSGLQVLGQTFVAFAAVVSPNLVVLLYYTSSLPWFLSMLWASMLVT